MEWLSKMNSAIDYIEANINEKIDYAQAANKACCSPSRFQNMFLFITDINLSEYVRRRRMSLSANELINSGIKIIDLSLKYGYESPEAFTRSFKAFHGISPSEVRRFCKYIDYPKIMFEIKITGGHFMSKSTQMETYKEILIKMETIEMPETLKFAGLSSVGLPDFQNISVFHEKFKPGMAEKHTPYVEIGMSCNIVSDGGWYIFGCMVDSFEGLPNGLIGVDTGLNKFACLTFRVQPGENSTHELVGGDEGPGKGMEMASEYLKTEWIPKNLDKLYGYNAEHGNFDILKAEKNYHMVNTPTKNLETFYTIWGWFEVYKTDIQNDPEMCFYIPLK
jgi:AraC-like DNA-binding protein